jgi:hypothetical protein
MTVDGTAESIWIQSGFNPIQVQVSLWRSDVDVKSICSCFFDAIRWYNVNDNTVWESNVKPFIFANAVSNTNIKGMKISTPTHYALNFHTKSGI